MGRASRLTSTARRARRSEKPLKWRMQKRTLLARYAMMPLPAALSHTCGNLVSVSDAGAPLMIADQLGGAGKERPAVVTECGAAEDVPEAALAAGGSFAPAGTDVLQPTAHLTCNDAHLWTTMTLPTCLASRRMEQRLDPSATLMCDAGERQEGGPHWSDRAAPCQMMENKDCQIADGRRIVRAESSSYQRGRSGCHCSSTPSSVHVVMHIVVMHIWFAVRPCIQAS